jgi:hypothetical protein
MHRSLNIVALHVEIFGGHADKKPSQMMIFFSSLSLFPIGLFLLDLL